MKSQQNTWKHHTELLQQHSPNKPFQPTDRMNVNNFLIQNEYLNVKLKLKLKNCNISAYNELYPPSDQTVQSEDCELRVISQRTA